jgi:hypothetical protein
MSPATTTQRAKPSPCRAGSRCRRRPQPSITRAPTRLASSSRPRTSGGSSWRGVTRRLDEHVQADQPLARQALARQSGGRSSIGMRGETVGRLGQSCFQTVQVWNSPCFSQRRRTPADVGADVAGAFGRHRELALSCSSRARCSRSALAGVAHQGDVRQQQRRAAGARRAGRGPRGARPRASGARSASSFLQRPLSDATPPTGALLPLDTRLVRPNPWPAQGCTGSA